MLTPRFLWLQALRQLHASYAPILKRLFLLNSGGKLNSESRQKRPVGEKCKADGRNKYSTACLVFSLSRQLSM